MKTVTVEQGQSLFDICLQVYGSVEKIIELAILNNLSITDAIVPTQRINYKQTGNEIAAYFAAKNHRPATAVTESQLFKPEGIDFWGVEDDFIVQQD